MLVHPTRKSPPPISLEMNFALRNRAWCFNLYLIPCCECCWLCAGTKLIRFLSIISFRLSRMPAALQGWLNRIWICYPFLKTFSLMPFYNIIKDLLVMCTCSFTKPLANTNISLYTGEWNENRMNYCLIVIITY